MTVSGGNEDGGVSAWLVYVDGDLIGIHAADTEQRREQEHLDVPKESSP